MVKDIQRIGAPNLQLIEILKLTCEMICDFKTKRVNLISRVTFFESDVGMAQCI